MSIDVSSPDRETRRRNVLVVEDEEVVALDWSDTLSGLGWNVIGPAATLEAAQALVESGVGLDAAVLDIHLQGRWVHSLAEELVRRSVPFVLCTGYEMVDPEKRFADAPLIVKPINGSAVGEALSNLLRPQVPSEPIGNQAS